MRLCFNDAFGGQLLRDLKPEDAKFIREIGFRVTGVNSGDVNATDADIERAKRVLDDAGLTPGPFGGGGTTFHPDPAQRRALKERVAKALVVAGKLGCPTLRISAGSFHPTNRWLHHPENHTQKALDLFIENTKDLVEVAEKAKCCISPETTQWTIISSIDRMMEFVDRLDSPYVTVDFDPVNHMTADRVYDSGRFVQCAIAALGDRIGVIHVKDVMVPDKELVVHIDEAPMGTGVFDHAALIRATTMLEPWKTFSLEHIHGRDLVQPAYDHIQKVAARIGHTWSDPRLTRERWQKEKSQR